MQSLEAANVKAGLEYNAALAIFFAVFSPRLTGVSRPKPFTGQNDGPPGRVPRAGRQGAPVRRVTVSSM